MKVTPSFTSVILSVKFSEPALIYRKPLNLGSQIMVGSIKEGQTHFTFTSQNSLGHFRLTWWSRGMSYNQLYSRNGCAGGWSGASTGLRNDWQLLLYPRGKGDGVAEIQHVLQATFCSVLDVKVISVLPRAGYKTRTGAHVSQEACEYIWEWA